MTKNLFFFCLLFLHLAKSNGQIIIGDFESWNGNESNNWVSTNALMILGNPQSIYKSTDAHGGIFACEINTIKVKNKVPGFPIPDYTGSIFTGKQIGFNTSMGVPFSYKPSMLKFWYKYNARNNDSASIIAYTTKWNSTLNKRDTLSIGMGIIIDSVFNYTLMELNLLVLDSNANPDTAVVLFASSTVLSKSEGAKLLVDDVEFTGGSVGANEHPNNIILSIYPNPVQTKNFKIDFFNFQNRVSIDIFDIHGKCMYTETKINKQAVDISTNDWPAGMYLIHVIGESGFVQRKIIVQ